MNEWAFLLLDCATIRKVRAKRACPLSRAKETPARQIGSEKREKTMFGCIKEYNTHPLD